MTIDTIDYGRISIVESNDLPEDSVNVDWLEMDDMEIWKTPEGKFLAVDCSGLFEDEDESLSYDPEMGFDPYLGCYTDDC